MPIDAPTTFNTPLDAAKLVQRAFEIEADDKLIESARAFSKSPLKGLGEDAQKFINLGANQLKTAIKKYDEAEDKSLWRDYLDASYAELFLGVTREQIAPQESVYSGSDKLMFSKKFFQTRELMNEWGFKKPSWFAEPEDHIACEWAFLNYLLDKVYTEKTNGNESVAKKAESAAKAFKEKHMDVWTESSYQDMTDMDDMGFYSGIISIARGIQPIIV